MSEVVGTENIQKVPVSNVPNLIKFRYEPITSNDYQNKIFVNKRLKNKKKKLETRRKVEYKKPMSVQAQALSLITSGRIASVTKTTSP